MLQSTHSIGDSFKLIANGDADAMICGGAEATIRPTGLAGFCAMRAMSTRNDDPAKSSRPFDTAACSGFVYGLASATSFIQSGMYNNALVIGADCLSRITDYTDRNTCVLFGDGAGAVVVGH